LSERAPDEAAHELVVYAVLHDEAARRRAALNRRAERAPEHAVQRQIQVRVVEHIIAFCRPSER
jgi:hypothetical protein